MSNDTRVEKADQQVREPSGANTGGLATRFVEAAPAPHPVTAASRAAAGETAPVDGEHSLAADVAALLAEEAPVGDPRKSRRSANLLWAGLFASSLGLCALLFPVYANSFSSLQQHRDQRVLLNEFTSASSPTS